MYDAERWLANADHSVHGIKSSVYRMQDEMKEVKSNNPVFIEML